MLVLEHTIKILPLQLTVNLISLMDTKIKYQLNNFLPFKYTMISDSYLITISNLQISCLFVQYYNAHQEIIFTEVCVKTSTSYCSKEVVSSYLKK